MAALALAINIRTVRADDFYAGKEITLYVGSPAGGPYDAYARLFARHMGRHIPGNPGIVVQNMPGASGRRLMGYMYNVAPKDGTTIAAPQRAVAFDPLLGVRESFRSPPRSPGSAAPTRKPMSASSGTLRRS